MFTLEKEFRFEASHQLIHHDGACARLHGHSWVGRVIVRGRVLMDVGPKQGMLIDYGDISKALKPLIAQLDHYHLNDVLDTDAPTSERLAVWLFERLEPYMGEALWKVRIEETCSSACEYER